MFDINRFILKLKHYKVWHNLQSPLALQLAKYKVLCGEDFWWFSCIQRLQFLKPLERRKQSRLWKNLFYLQCLSDVKIAILIHTSEDCVPAFQPWICNNVFNVRNKPPSIWRNKTGVLIQMHSSKCILRTLFIPVRVAYKLTHLRSAIDLITLSL